MNRGGTVSISTWHVMLVDLNEIYPTLASVSVRQPKFATGCQLVVPFAVTFVQTELS
jgi:hypothetical protein